MIVIGDLHLTDKSLYRKAQGKLLQYLLENFDGEVLIFLGDIFNTSAPLWNTYSMFKEFLTNRKGYTHILSGNHDQSRFKGNALNGIHLMDNVTVYFCETEVVIDGVKCLMLPYQNNMEHYPEIKFNGDYVFCHFTNPEDQFANEGIELLGVGNAKQIYGHTHTSVEYPDKNKIVLGVPMVTRNGESNGHLLKISSKIANASELKNKIIPVDENIEEVLKTYTSLEKIKLPIFFDIQDIEYGESIPNPDYLYNIKNAPSFDALYDMYSIDYIRKEGITLREYDIIDAEEELLYTDDVESIGNRFIEFAKEVRVARDVKDTAMEYLSK